jgi:hypothetical protein
MAKKKTKKKSVDDKICDALNLEYDDESKELDKPKEETNIVPVEKKEDIDKDYICVRKNLKDIISKGNDAIDGILEVAQEGDQPRAYEVAAQMIKTVAEANKDLIDLHKKLKDIKIQETINNNISNTTNAIYVGSTKELQDLVNQSRSSSRRITHDVIDAEVVENDQ